MNSKEDFRKILHATDGHAVINYRINDDNANYLMDFLYEMANDCFSWRDDDGNELLLAVKANIDKLDKGLVNEYLLLILTNPYKLATHYDLIAKSLHEFGCNGYHLKIEQAVNSISDDGWSTARFSNIKKYREAKKLIKHINVYNCRYTGRYT